MRIPSTILAFAFLRAAAAHAEEPWPAYLHDNQHTGRADFLLDPAILGPSPAWSAPAGYAVPLVVGDRIFAMRSQFGVGADVTHVTCFDLATGDVIWDKLESLVFPSALAYHGGRVVYAEIDQETADQLLVVRNADDGEVDYSVAIPNALVSMPTIYENPDSGEIVAYLSAPAVTNFGIGPSMTAVTLGSSSGAVKWADPIERHFGDTSFPTIVEDFLVVAGPCHYYAYELETGAVNRFHNGGCVAGGGATATYDAVRRRFYFLETFEGTSGAKLTAWRFESYAAIERVWTSADDVSSADGIAVDDEGHLWAPSFDRLYKIDSADGATLDSVSGQFALGIVPIVSGDFIWTYESSGFGETVVYDRRTLEEAARFAGARGDLNSAFGAPGALTPEAFLLDHGRVYDYPGFDVFLRATAPHCGDPAAGFGAITAGDALFALRAAVGTGSCETCICDLDDSGSVTASDALRLLQKAIALPVRLNCPACA